tara:strand:+ start:66 stop:248 length:183 start_codon:yes stop_codon:yes gene_type:complete
MEEENKQKSAKEAFLDVLLPNVETIGDLQKLSERLCGFKFSILVFKYNFQKSKIQFNKLT